MTTDEFKNNLGNCSRERLIEMLLDVHCQLDHMTKILEATAYIGNPGLR